jgi:hypothetical protein
MSDKETLDEIVFKARQVIALKADLDTQDLSNEDRQQKEREILDTLESLGLEQKMEAYCQVIEQLKANNDYLSTAISKWQGKKKSNETTIDWLRGNMQSGLVAVNKQQVDTGLHKISISKRTTLEIDYDKLAKQGIPELKYKPLVIDKTATKKAIQDLGVELEGVQEVEKTSIRIT